MLEQTWRGAQVHGFGMEMRVCSLRRGRMTGCCTTLDATTWRGDEETARVGVVRGGRGGIRALCAVGPIRVYKLLTYLGIPYKRKA